MNEGQRKRIILVGGPSNLRRGTLITEVTSGRGIMWCSGLHRGQPMESPPRFGEYEDTGLLTLDGEEHILLWTGFIDVMEGL